MFVIISGCVLYLNVNTKTVVGLSPESIYIFQEGYYVRHDEKAHHTAFFRCTNKSSAVNFFLLFLGNNSGKQISSAALICLWPAVFKSNLGDYGW